MTTTPKFGIPLISGQQNQPEVTHNQMVVVMQALAGGAIAEQNAPPGSPTEGDCYIVGAIPTGAWSGHAHAIAIYFGGWLFVPGFDNDGVIIPMTAAQNGLSIFNNDTGELWAWQTSSWIVVTGGTGASRLIDLLDVLVSETGTEDGDALVWDESAGKWIARELNLAGLADVQVTETSTIDGDVLAWDEGAQAWVPMTISFPSEVGLPSLEELTDVDIISPLDGQVLTYHQLSGKWINAAGGGGGSDSDGSINPQIPSWDVVGVTDGSNAPPGGIGEEKRTTVLFAAGVNPSGTGLSLNITSVLLTPGDWEVSGVGGYYPSTVNATSISMAVSLVSNTLPSNTTDSLEGQFEMSVTFSPNSANCWPVGPRRVNVTVNTTAYLVGEASYSGAGTPVFWGFIKARRVR
jgi:hypothetical protein